MIAGRSHRLLILTYSFPPVSSPASLRMLKFSRILSNMGWKVHVLCPARTAQKRQDISLLKQVPSAVKIYRAAMCDISGFQSEMRSRISSATIEDCDADRKKRVGWINILKKIKHRLFYPDIHVTWYPLLYLFGSILCKKNGYDVILATGDPWSVVMAGLRLARFFDIPFVADFRELWSGHSHANHFNREVLEQIKKSEQAVFAGARLVIGNSPDERDILESVCNTSPRPTFIDLENGFDASDIIDLFDRIGTPDKNDMFTIAYAGSFYYRRPDAFFEAISCLLAEHTHLSSRIKVKIAGVPEQRVVRLASELGLNKVVQFLGYLPYDRVLELLLRSDMLLAILGTPQSRTFDPTVPAKLYEYIALGRPTLLLAKPGGATRFFKKVGANGAVADNESVVEIRSAIEHFFDLYCKDDLFLNCPIKIGAYTREAIAKKLSRNLSALKADTTHHQYG